MRKYSGRKFSSLRYLRENLSRSNGHIKAVLLLMLGMFAALGLALLIPALVSLGAPSGGSLFPPEMQAKKFTPVDAVGDLGGMPVTIPHYFANYLEYEDDPSWGEKRDKPAPKRDHESKIVSFGFKVRFPDMAGLSNKELEKEFKQSSIYETFWIDVGISANKHFGDGFGLQRLANTAITDGPFSYVKHKNNFYGLEHFQPIGANESERVPFKINFYDKDFFYERSTDNTINTFIECSNVNHAAAPCEMRFVLAHNLRISVRVHFRRGLLFDWIRLKKSVSNLLLGFRYERDKELKPPSLNSN